MPPPPSGGGKKYVIIGILLLLGALGVVFAGLSGSQKEETAQKPVKKQEEVKRSTALAENEFEVPEENDAGPPSAAAPEPEKKKASGPARSENDEWDCAGTIDAQKLREAISEHRIEVRTCYERRLKINNQLQGSLMLSLKVNKQGKIAAAQTSGSLRDSEVYACVKKLASTWSFPTPSEGACATLKVPFNFTPSGH